MAIGRNVISGAEGTGRVGTSKAPVGLGASRMTLGTSPGAGVESAAVSNRPPAKEVGTTVVTAAAPSSGSKAGVGAIPAFEFRPEVIAPQVLLPPHVFMAPVNKTTTQIAQAALNELREATPAAVREAVNTIKSKNVSAGQLLNYLERKTRVGEVLNKLAKDWAEPTPQDFADAFQMPATAEKFPVMDSIVSIAILNDPDLRGELEDENTTEPSEADLMENRRIVWQWPPPGTPFTPPYLLMVAVEREDTTQAQNIIQSILGDLVDLEGYKIPRAAAQKLGISAPLTATFMANPALMRTRFQ
jgi:hypothetical protein